MLHDIQSTKAELSRLLYEDKREATIELFMSLAPTDQQEIYEMSFFRSDGTEDRYEPSMEG